MDVGEIPASLPSLTKVNRELQKLVKENVENNLKVILSDIADRHRLSRNDLFQKYLSDDKITITQSSDGPVTKRKRRNIPLYERCTALTSSLEQCSRKKKVGQEFCGSHLNSRNFGVV